MTALPRPRQPGLLGRGLLWDVLLVAVGVGLFFAFPFDLGFITRILIMIVFVLSLDLVLGYAGVATLGQAAMYGTGAYAAGLFAIHVSADPILGLVAGAVAGAVVAFISGLVLMRAQGLTLLMLSIAVAEVLQEVANKARPVTGGADGLRGIRMDPLFGIWEFDFIGRTGYWYVLAVLMLVLLFLKVVVNSPFGLSARGIQESPERMRAIGTPVYWRLVSVYTLAGSIAGIAGALAAQVTALVSLEVYNFDHSAEALIMLVLGGTGRLYGAVVGVAIFMVVEHLAAAVDPFNWLFLIGALVLAVVFFVPSGLLGLPKALTDLVKR
ncbi:branched-chain amino acid ABC transporter permease [Pelagovum pacificum]|uniref:Branched-chain amino acid ABC transporter permease n=1 Tax=Pelagovum pacificum TaxID=2588711 RepID=A0A5C5GBJ6_9RHOB|nr:branched-chain amino acid ABC transporter permease [Pelagovum pacificum]QQA42373.1 branched-chain amino acid ABC transporter permease [Pelagovum pacificum]TNY31457.1 branched-chain amino acid ABC transporter permease [Pelagovum pacificum]